MRHAGLIFRWELSKILTSWRKTMAVFLLPAAIMVFAINLFPQIIKYISTGTLGATKVIVVNTPQSFKDFSGKRENMYGYVYAEESLTYPELQEKYTSDVKKGAMILRFISGDKDFDGAVSEYYKDTENGCMASIELFVAPNNYTSEMAAEQFRIDVLDAYSTYLDSIFNPMYDSYQSVKASVDEFNPFIFVLDNRAVANKSASRVVPGITVLLMYYCVYSLSLDMIGMEKERGFLSKLRLTPVKPFEILAGKIGAIMVLVSGSVFVTFSFLFISSWVNSSNNAMSLLPFGMLLLPEQIPQIFLITLSLAFCAASFCFKVCLDLSKFADTVVNLQLPLLIILIDFFGQMFLGGFPTVFAEYLIPIHNGIAIFKDMYRLENGGITAVIAVILINTLTGALLFRSCVRKLKGDYK